MKAKNSSVTVCSLNRIVAQRQPLPNLSKAYRSQGRGQVFGNKGNRAMEEDSQPGTPDGRDSPPRSNFQRNPALTRLRIDYLNLKKEPLPYISAEPDPSNMLVWHYVLRGPEQTVYFGGFYHGKIVFTENFPFKPPAIYMLTPNGRFKPNTRLCLSISDFHPELWNPTWCVGTIIQGLLSFMLDYQPTVGSVQTTDYEKRNYASKSLEYNLKQKVIRELFPELCEEMDGMVKYRKIQADLAIGRAWAASEKKKHNKKCK